MNLADSGLNTYSTLGNMTINAPPAATTTLVINGGDIGIVPKGTAFARNVNVTGSTSASPAWTVNLVSGGLPPGMKLLTGKDFSNGGANTNAAQIAGIPNTAGSYVFTLSVSDGAGGFGQRQYLVRVSNLAISTLSINSGTVGQAYTQTINVQNAVAPLAFSLTTGALPPGLNIDSATGTISGTPSSTSANTIGVQAVDSTGDTFVRFFVLNIYNLQITTPFVLPTAVSGRPYTVPLAISPPGSYTWSATGLPAGLSINTTTGVISGTVPTGTQVISAVSVTAANSATALVKNFTLFTVALSGSTILTGLPNAPLGEVPAGAVVNTILNVNGGAPPYTVAVESGSTLPPGIQLVPANQINGSQFFGRFALGGVATTAGTYNFKLRYTDSAGVFAVRTITLGVRNIGLAEATLGIGLVNQSYSAQLMAVGTPGPFTFTLSPTFNNALPPGLNLSASGLVNGTPTSTGSFNFNVDFTDGVNTRRQAVNVTIQATGNQRIDFGGPFLPFDDPMGLSVNSVFTPTGGAGTHTWSLVSGSLPPGMQLLFGATLPPLDVAPPSAILAGAPSAADDYLFRIRVDDSTGNFGINDFSIHVTPDRLGPVAPISDGTSVPPLHVGTPYSFAFTLINGRPPSAYSTQPGTLLPVGVGLSSTGVLSGTPQEAGNFPIALQEQDADGFTFRNGSNSLRSYPAGGPIGVLGNNSQQLGDATAGIPYSYNLNDILAPGYGVGPFNWAVDSGTLPAGLSVAGNIISGTPSAVGLSSFAVVATDSQGTQHLASLALNVSNYTMSPLPGALPGGIAGAPYSPVTFVAAGGPGPFTYQAAWFSDFPPGLTLSPSGVLSGTPTVQGPFTIFIDGLDPAKNRIRQRYTMTIGPPGAPIPAITPAPTNVSVGYTIGDPAPPPVPINIGSTAAAFSFTASASGGIWFSVTPSSGNTSVAATINANFNPTGLTAGTYNGAITITAGSTSNSPIVIPVTLTVAAAPICSYSLIPGSSTILASGGGLSFAVNTGVGCNWTASTSDAFVAVSTPSGTGTGPVSLTLAANASSTPRTGTVRCKG